MSIKPYVSGLIFGLVIAVSGVVVAQVIDEPIVEDVVIEPEPRVVVLDRALEEKVQSVMSSTTLDVFEATKRAYQATDTDRIVGRLDTVITLLNAINEKLKP